MKRVTAEWVVVSDETAIVSCETGDFWFLDLKGYGDLLPFTHPMTGNGTRRSTAGLLNGAVVLGFANKGGVTPSAISLPKYVLDLIGSFHITRRTPGHFAQAAKRLRELNRPDIASYLETHGREETGHDRLSAQGSARFGLASGADRRELHP